MKEDQKKFSEPADFSEFDGEVEYRRQLQLETEQRSGDSVSWEDDQEKLVREEYVKLQQERQEEVIWDTSGEREAQVLGPNP